MLDYFAIFTKGGALLWAFQLTALKGDPLSALVRECLLEDRSAERSYTYNAGAGGGYTLKWSFNNVRCPPRPALPPLTMLPPSDTDAAPLLQSKAFGLRTGSSLLKGPQRRLAPSMFPGQAAHALLTTVRDLTRRRWAWCSWQSTSRR